MPGESKAGGSVSKTESDWFDSSTWCHKIEHHDKTRTKKETDPYQTRWYDNTIARRIVGNN